MSDQQRLSRQLYDVLDEVGASEKVRQIHQQSAVELEILDTIKDNTIYNKCNIKTHVYYCGSRFEGSVTPDLASDTDVIIHFDDKPVVLDPASIKHGRSLLLVRDHYTSQGYVKLQWLENGRPLTDRNDLSLTSYLASVDARYDVKGRMCAQHINMDDMQGPAMQSIDESGEHYKDTVFAFTCKSIPDHVRSWMIRQKKHGWPTAQMTDTMSKMGCMLVSAGHWESHERDLEWRLSFSLQERLLMSSLNSVQHKVYIVLKMIKKTILGRSIKGESISSYHCKTCIFHAVEGTPTDFWIPDNMINCILYCLELLLKWTEVGCCPNYFIKDQNLFSKEGFVRIRDQLRTELRRLTQMQHDLVFLLDSDDIGRVMRSKDRTSLMLVIGAKKNEYISKLKIQVIHRILRVNHSIVYSSKNIQNTARILRSTGSINGHPKPTTQSVVNYLQPWLHLHIAKSLASKAVDTDDRHSADMLLKKANEHFCYASSTDVTSVRFAKASVLYTLGKYEECRTLLLDIERDLTFRVLSLCPCGNSDYTYHITEKHQYDHVTEMISQKSVAIILKCHIASCVTFLRSESRIVPTVLQYEMYRSLDTEHGSSDKTTSNWLTDSAVIDARFYLNLLQYLVFDALHMDMERKRAVDNLKAKVDDSNSYKTNTGRNLYGHIDTAYNVLGWIYLRQKRVSEAVKCFRESLRIRPNHNAANIHLRDMNYQQAKCVS